MLYVDNREGSAELIPLLGDQCCPFDGLGSTADVLIYGNGPDGEVLVGVEVKTFEDLLSSEATGRLAATQVPQMLVDLDQAYLLVVGRYRAGHDGRLEVLKHIRRSGKLVDAWCPYNIGQRPAPYAYLEHFLIELSVIGVQCKVVDTYRDAACWLICLRNWWHKPWDRHRAMRKLDESRDLGLMPTMDEATRQMLKFAKQIPGFGYEKAMSAALHFENGTQMACAPTQEWEKVDGVGRVLAKQAVDAYRRTRG